MSELKDIQSPISQDTFTDELKAFFNTASTLKTPAAIWRKPNSNSIHAICQVTQAPYSLDELENAPAGFVFSPYNGIEESSKQLFIKADIYLQSTKKGLSSSPSVVNSELTERFEQIWKDQLKHQQYNVETNSKAPSKEASKKENYLELVSQSIGYIKDGICQKIVPSRIKTIDLTNEFHPVGEVLKLMEAYGDAFVYATYSPENGIWLGATPELLLSINADKEFQTVSLAGTQAIQGDFNVAKAAWTQKEIEEQALVSRYIVNCFKKIRLREFEEYGPKTVRAGNLIHLKTTFKVNMAAVNFPQLGTVMLELLHPTSAVCGMPQEAASKFLANHEVHDREFYSGYLGPVNIEEETNLFVNLRCMKICQNQAVLYAGAGVTEDSEPESEWLETEMKFRTLLNIVQ